MSILLSWLGIIVLGFLLFVNAVARDDATRIDAVGVPDRETAAPGWIPVSVNGIVGVIVPANDADSFDITADDYWTPDEADIETAEVALRARQGYLAHFRQYTGIVQDGRRKVSINGFCDSFDQNWYRSPVIVMDGGDCFFQAISDVQSGEIESFYFNGYA